MTDKDKMTLSTFKDFMEVPCPGHADFVAGNQDKAREIVDTLFPLPSGIPPVRRKIRETRRKEALMLISEALESQRKELEELRKELERERIRLAACGVIALSNTTDTAKQSRLMCEEYQSASAQDVANAVDKQMELRELCGELVEFARDINNECKSPYYSMNELYKWLEIRSEQELAKAKERLK